MKKIKVFLQYPWKVSDSQYYKNMINYPPAGVEYLANIDSFGMIINKRNLWISNLMKKIIRNSITLFKLPIINAYLTKSKENFDLIHCAHCISKNTDKPWVADFEKIWQFFISSNPTPYSIQRVREILARKNCKKVIAWTIPAKNEISKMFPEVNGKIEVVTYALPLRGNKKKKHRGINLLFVGRYFYSKGGMMAVEVFDSLTKKYKNVSATVISNVPENIKKKFESNKKIKFLDLMPQKRLFEEIYPLADIFVYPGFSDTFGFAFTEAMSFGIPIITVDGFARKEIVGNCGLVIKNNGISWGHWTREWGADEKPILNNEEEMTKNLYKTTEKLILNKKMRDKISKECINAIKFGRFSIKKRNSKLKRIYKEAVA